jgi:hypothetical protein
VGRFSGFPTQTEIPPLPRSLRPQRGFLLIADVQVSEAGLELPTAGADLEIGVPRARPGRSRDDRAHPIGL